MNGILSRQYSTTSLLSSPLASKLRGVVSGGDCAKVSPFSLAMLLKGENVGGDCARVLSVVLGEMEDERLVFLESAFIGLDLVPLGWQLKASPLPENAVF